jgi:amidase
MADIAFASARRQATLIRSRKLGCLELLDHYIARVERLDGALNAVVVRDFERARKRARALDRKGDIAGPLHGIPMTMKESFDVAGLSTCWGFPEHRDKIARGDALAVERLQAAGAVVFGKTNVPRALADWQSYNAVYGATANPWSAAHTPGGSSGGAAAAMAAGLSGLEIGSDIGGSIRVPAHFCGVFGHKPTWGLCPPRGHSLVGAAAMTDISVIGPLARSADDLALALDAIAGPDPAETALTLALPPPRAKTLAELRVAIWAGDRATATDAATVARLQELARMLRRAGCKVSLTARPAFDPTEAYHVYLKLLYAAMGARQSEAERQRTRDWVAGLAAEDMSADAVMRRCVDMSHAEWLAVHERRHQIRNAWSAFFGDWDVMLCPVAARAALPHTQQGEPHERTMTVNGKTVAYSDMLFWPGITCGFHLPASVAPLGQDAEGLPIGVQIAGPLYGDRTTIEVARLLERHWRGFTPPPGMT